MQRVQEISEGDCYEEGIERPNSPFLGSAKAGYDNARNAFRILWDSINAKRGFGWSDNPWVVAVAFDVRRANIDQMRNAA